MPETLPEVPQGEQHPALLLLEEATPKPIPAALEAGVILGTFGDHILKH